MGASTSQNNTRLAARHGWHHTECWLATSLLSSGQPPAPPLRSAKPRGFVGQNEDSKDHVSSNYFGANGT